MLGKLVFVLASVALLSCAIAQPSDDSGAASAQPFAPSDNLRNQTQQILSGAVQNISAALANNSIESAAFWYAADVLTLVQNSTLNADQVVSFWRFLFSSANDSESSNASQPLQAGNFTILSQRFVLEFGGSYSSPNGAGLIMRIWRFQPQAQAQGAAGNETSSGDQQQGGSGLLPQDASDIQAIRSQGVFRIYREALTGPVPAEGQSSEQFNSFLEQLSSQLSSGSQSQDQPQRQQ